MNYTGKERSSLCDLEGLPTANLVSEMKQTLLKIVILIGALSYCSIGKQAKLFSGEVSEI